MKTVILRASNLRIAFAFKALKIGKIQREQDIGLRLPSGDKVHVIIHRASTNAVGAGLV